jgi:sugar/nucleoside kinase (ribokinase family)
VAVTAGLLGSAAALGGRLLVEPAAPAEGPMLDATGAGDAYAAALVGELLGVGWPPDEPVLRGAMQAGSRLGALVARVVGAQARVSGEEGRR